MTPRDSRLTTHDYAPHGITSFSEDVPVFRALHSSDPETRSSRLASRFYRLAAIAGLAFAIIAGVFCVYQLFKTPNALYVIAFVLCLFIGFVCADILSAPILNGPGDDTYPPNDRRAA